MVSGPKMPVNSRGESRGGGAEGELLVDGQVVAAGSWCAVVAHGACSAREADAGAEAGDAGGEVGVGGFERGVGVGAGGVRDGPVQPRSARGRGEVLVGVVADGDDEVVVAYDVGDVRGAGGVERSPCRRATRTARGWTRGARVGAGGGGRPAAAARPQRRGQLASGRSCGCRRTPPARHRQAAGSRAGQRLGPQPQVGTAPVTFGADPVHEARRPAAPSRDARPGWSACSSASRTRRARRHRGPARRRSPTAPDHPAPREYAPDALRIAHRSLSQ